MRTYTLGELSEKAGLPARTIRYYRTTGLLPSGRRDGRSVQYDEAHLGRLQQIGELRDQGLKLDAIRAMFTDVGTGNELMLAGPSGEWLLADATRDFTVTELAEFLGDKYFDLLGPLVATGYLERRSSAEGTTWHCPDLPLLRSALQMASIGTDVTLTARARDLVQRRLRRLADDLAQMWEEEHQGRYPNEAATGLPAEIETIRAAAWQTTAYVMAKEIDRAVRTNLDPAPA